MIASLRSTLAGLATPLIVSCAGGGGGSDALDRYSIRYRTDVQGYRFTFESSADQIVETLPEVYGRLGFPGGLASNRDELLFISPSARAEGRIYEDEPNSNYLDCGRGIAGPRADSYVLEFAIVTRIVPLEAGGTEIEVIVDGLARNRDHNLNNVPCRGTGKLEGQLADLLTFMLPRGGDRQRDPG